MKIRNRANALHAYFFKVFELEELERATTKGASEPSLESEINAPTNPAASAATAAQSHAAQTTALLVDSHTTDGEVDSASGAVIEEDNAAVSATITGDNTASVASSGGDNAATLATIGEDIAALSAALEVATANINEGSMTTPAEIEDHSMESTASVEEDITVNNYAENNVSTAWIHGANVQSAVSAIGEDNTASEARNDNDAAAVPTTIEEDNESIGVLTPNEGNNTAIDRGARNPDSANNISHNSSSSLNRRRPADGVAPISAKKGRN